MFFTWCVDRDKPDDLSVGGIIKEELNKAKKANRAQRRLSEVLSSKLGSICVLKKLKRNIIQSSGVEFQALIICFLI